VRYLIARDFTRKIVQRYGIFFVRASFLATFFVGVLFFSEKDLRACIKSITFAAENKLRKLRNASCVI